MAALPLLCCGLAVFAPFLRAALLRAHDRATRNRIILWGVVSQTVVLGGFVLTGVSPVDEEGTPTGLASDLGAAFVIIGIISGIVAGVVYHRAPQPD